MISESVKDILNRLPLDEVMENNGYHFYGESRGKDKRYKMYACPFHGDNDPSFRVDIAPSKGKQYCGTYCFACKGASGDATYGAIQLQQALLKQAGEPHEFLDACKRLARDFHIVLDNQDYNCYWRRSNAGQYVEPQKEIVLNIADRPFTDEELRALGCKVDILTRYDWDSDMDLAMKDEDGKYVRRYSFSPSYYRKGNPEPWDSNILKRMFNLYPLCQDWETSDENNPNYAYISRAEKVQGSDEMRSYKIRATRSYPIFAFKYEDEEGWMVRKYEPYCKPEISSSGRAGRNLKFTWWYEGDRKRSDMHTRIYGDNDVMRALKEFSGSSDVVQTDNTRAPLTDKSYFLTVGDQDVENKRKVFDKIIICSGPRDALSTYFHSDAHVVWPHSETTMIPEHIMRKLFAISDKLYVMYDLDETGEKAMNELGMMYYDLKLIDLPEDLSSMTDRRTGKPCKDAEQYFNNYDVSRYGRRITNVNEHFACMLADAKCMKFWDVEYGTKRDKENSRRVVDKFTMNYSNLTRFLQGNGIYNYVDESGAAHYVKVDKNMVEVIPDKDFMTLVKLLMKDYLFSMKEINNVALSNAISTQKKIDASSLKEIKTKKLMFKTWGKDFDWFFFPNCAVKVTADGIARHDYDELEGHVNRRAILEGPDYRLTEPLFTICENPEYLKRKERFEKEMADKCLTPEQKVEIRRDFNNYRKLWQWKLEFTRPIQEMPYPLQFVWDTCRIHWEKEEMGFMLTEEEQQREKMHFVNKAASIGYLLSRYRTDSMQQMTTFTDYKVKDESKSSGGTGKTTFRRFIESVRKVRFISGDGFCTAPDKMPTNFQEFEDTVDQVVMIDDLPGDIRGEEFKNLTTNMVVRTLYQNKYTIPADRVPKIFCTMNRTLDMDNPSVYRRCFSSYTSDYYHPADYSGKRSERTPTIKFGKDIIADATHEEYNCIRNLMLQCCQFYLRTQQVILPPMEQDGINRYLYSTLKDEVFVEWANDFFSDERHFGKPVALGEMVLSYLEMRSDTKVTEKLVEDTKKKFKKSLRTYCDNYGIIANPDVVFAPKRKPSDWDKWNEFQKSEYRSRPSSDRKDGLTRTPMWTTVFAGERPLYDRPRELRTNRGYYFFRTMQEVPTDVWDLMPADEVDWERMFE